MRRFILLTCAPLAFFLAAAETRADGYCPWFNIIDARFNNYPKEMARINGFWHGYYGSMQNYYGNLSHLDWVAYYKNHGNPIGCVPGPCGGPSHVQMQPVFVMPTVQWGVPGTVIEPPLAPHGPTMVPPMAPMFYPQ
jgi:hypothetical protein